MGVEWLFDYPKFILRSSHMLKRGLARTILCIVVMGSACNLPLVAQKLHNEARDKLAQQIKSDFEQLTSPDGNIFEQAIKNAEAINDADIQQWRNREHTLMDSVATTLPFMTWGELQELTFTSRNQLLDVSRDVLDDGFKKAKVSLDGIKAELDKVKSEEEGIQKELEPFEKADKDPLPTVKQIEDALKKTLEDGSPLNLKLDDLQAKISTLPDDFSNLKKIVESLQAPQGLNKLILQTKLLMLQNEQARLELRQTHFKERQTKLADFEDHVAKYAGGSQQVEKRQSTLQAIQDQENQIKDLENQLKNSPAPNSKKTPADLLKEKTSLEALMELSKDDLHRILAYEKDVNDELVKERRKVEIRPGTETMPDAIRTCADFKRACDDPTRKKILVDTFGSFWQVVNEICKPSYASNDKIFESLKNFAQNGPGVTTEPDEFCPIQKQQPAKQVTPSREQRLVTVLNKLNNIMDLLSVRYDLFVEQTNLSHDELIFHIRMMRLNAQEHEVLLSSGITGLATYEAGGIKPEDVANIIHTAQTLATAAIAARVK
jgi:hypothetical protein